MDIFIAFKQLDKKDEAGSFPFIFRTRQFLLSKQLVFLRFAILYSSDNVTMDMKIIALNHIETVDVLQSSHRPIRW